MKKTHLIVLAFASAFALSALVASSASALTFEKAHFLINNAEAPANTPYDDTTEFLIENVLNGASFICSVLFEGTVGPGGTGSITKIFNLAGVESKELTATGVACSQEKTCEKAEASPDGLPFKIEARKDPEDGKFYVFYFIKYEFACTVLGIKIEELCEPPTGSAAGVGGEVTNLATDFEANSSTEPLFTCNGNTEENTIIFIPGNLTSSTSGSLSVS
jgi:hypothetical protein